MKQVRIMELRGTYKGGGGPDKTILLSAAKHNREKFFVLVTYLRNPDDDDFQIGMAAEKFGVPNYIEVWDRSMIDLKCLLTLHRLLREHKISIIHVHDQKTTLLGFLLKIVNPKIKVMNTAHGWIVNSQIDNLKQKIQYAMLKTFPLHIAVSKATESLMLNVGFRPQTIKVLYNSIDCNTWRRENGNGSKIKKEFNIPKDAFVIGTIGRISIEKDLPTFLKVAQNILKLYPATMFLVVGDGKNDGIIKELKILTKSLDIGESVIFTGHRTDLLDIYRSLNLFLMTSLTEGLPNTVLEAMAMEIPVVSTSVGGVPELVKDNKTGYLCKVGDVDQLTKVLVELLNSRDLRKSCSLAGRDDIVRLFSFENRLSCIEEIYCGLVGIEQ